MHTGVNPLTLVLRGLWRRSDADDDAGSDCPGHTPRMSQREYPVARLECVGLGRRDCCETRCGHRQYGQIMSSIGGEQLRWHSAPVRESGLEGTVADDMGVRHD